MPGQEDDLIEDDPIIEDDEDNEEDLEIDLDDDDGDDVDADVKSRNKAFASMRIENKELKGSVDTLSRTVEELKQQRAAPPVAAPVVPEAPDGLPKTDEEWDALAEKDWKKAVDLRSIQNAQNIIHKQTQATRAETTLTTSKQKVLAAHPELNDNNSEKAKIFLTILDQNPDYLTLPKGPLYAMRDMEDYMENTLGYKRNEIRSAEKKGAEREATRQHRIVLNKGVGRAPVSEGNKVVITKDEMEFCKFNDIDPKEYARNRQKLSKSGKTEGVSV